MRKKPRDPVERRLNTLITNCKTKCEHDYVKTMDELARRLGGVVAFIPTTNGRPGLLMVYGGNTEGRDVFYDLMDRKFYTCPIRDFMASRAGLYVNCL